jgi:hypothetical protein
MQHQEKMWFSVEENRKSESVNILAVIGVIHE